MRDHHERLVEKGREFQLAPANLRLGHQRHVDLSVIDRHFQFMRQAHRETDLYALPLLLEPLKGQWQQS
ncbi:hypothetical protein D3C81_1846910 [compost metagenome]